MLSADDVFLTQEPKSQRMSELHSTRHATIVIFKNIVLKIQDVS